MRFIQSLFKATQSSVMICMLAIAGVAQVHAAKPPPAGLAISAASWGGTTLTANGTAITGKDGGGAVTIFDADTTTSLGSTSPANGGNGSWNFSTSTCAENIYAEQDGITTASFAVSGAICGTPPTAQCSDGIDNDGDGLIDFPYDPGCADANDDDEIDVPSEVAECNDGIDNDGDGLTDFPADPGCSRGTDNDETDQPPIDPQLNPQTDFKIMMNYELGMHCTGFEFAYCCVLPVYNSILAQVVKPNQSAPQHGGDFPMLMEGDPNEGLDALGRETVVRDKGELDASGNFKKYVLKYWHEAQPRNDGRGKGQSSLLISAVEGNSLMAWNTRFDSAALNPDGTFVTDDYNGSQGVVQGDGDFNDPSDNYQNAVWNHLYIYNGLEGEFACSAPSAAVGDRCSEDADCGAGGVCNVTSDDDQKTRLGVNGHVVYPADCGAALHPMGPVTQGGDPNNPVVDNTCADFSNGNVLTFSGDKGTVVYTQMKVLENLPVMLTSPDIWEALGLPLTPFEDSIDFFSDPGLLDEDSVRPFVAMKAQMHDYDPSAPGGAGAATLDSNGDPVIGFGTAPIDIPNCERCHSNGPDGTLIDIPVSEGGGQLAVANSPNPAGSLEWTRTQEEYSYWNAYYEIDTGAGDSDWYSRLKSAAVSMLTAHDTQHGTSFTANYPGTEETGVAPQNTRLGHESVICQRCHADNVIAAVKSAECGAGNADPNMASETCEIGTLIKPITEAIHNNHRGVNMADASGDGGPIVFADSLGRDGGCQGCHPAHRSNGDMMGYPITLAGTNYYYDGDNRGASGGCFVGRDVHSNPNKDSDGVETPAHLNAVGQYLAANVANNGNGIWCTNCHNQLGQEMWKTENMTSLVHNQGDVNPRAQPTLAAVAAAVGTTEAQAIAWLDPKQGLSPGDDHSYAIWAENPGLCNYVAGYFGGSIDPAHDGAVATVEVNVSSAAECSTGGGSDLIDCSGEGGPAFHICGSVDGDGDFSVNALTFCTTSDCVESAQQGLPPGSVAVPVPFSAATDGRDHWLSAGEPHCADCHAAPFVEQSGHINAYPPFNYPRKASLMRYSRGHQDISCQGCHESIHGLYPVTPNIDTTTYAQAAALNHDGSHGPLKCGTCHEVDRNGIPTWMSGVRYNGSRIRTYDDAVAWAHTFTDEVSPLEPDGVCENCHGDRSGSIDETSGKWLRHSFVGRIGRQIQDKAEIDAMGHVAGGTYVDADDLAGLTSNVCAACHSLQGGPSGGFASLATCDNATWKSHNIDGRLSEKVWEYVSKKQNSGSTCGW
jgi:hypothetical protein